MSALPFPSQGSQVTPASHKRPGAQTRLDVVGQGGGSQGAFTQGALAYLAQMPALRSGEIVLGNMKGTSANALNFAVFVSNYNHTFNRHRGADPHAAALDAGVQALDRFWNKLGVLNPLLQFALDQAYALDDGLYPNLPPPWQAAMEAAAICKNALWDMIETWEGLAEDTRAVLFPALPWAGDIMKLPFALWGMAEHNPMINPTYALMEILKDPEIVCWDSLKGQGPIHLCVDAVYKSSKGEFSDRTFWDAELTPETVTGSAALLENGPVGWKGGRLYDGAYGREGNGNLDMIASLPDATDILVIVNAPEDKVQEGMALSKMHTLKTSEIHERIRAVQAQNMVRIHPLYYDPHAHLDRSARLNPHEEWLREQAEHGRAEMESVAKSILSRVRSCPGPDWLKRRQWRMLGMPAREAPFA